MFSCSSMLCCFVCEGKKDSKSLLCHFSFCHICGKFCFWRFGLPLPMNSLLEVYFDFKVNWQCALYCYFEKLQCVCIFFSFYTFYFLILKWIPFLVQAIYYKFKGLFSVRLFKNFKLMWHFVHWQIQ